MTIELKIKHQIYGTIAYIVIIGNPYIIRFINEKKLDQKILCSAYKCSIDTTILKREKNV